MANIKLSAISTRAPKDFDKQETKEKLLSILEKLDALQNLLYAESKHSILVVIQGMDASGNAAAPAKGEIQIFNRSHYEDILVTRVHNMIDDDMARKRMKAINQFEQLLKEHNNTKILKFYLHVSPEEQQERLKERIEDPAKQWKYNENDFREAKLWDEYMKVYEDCFEYCNDIPWTIVPADQNWYKEYVIASTLLDTLKGLDMKFPGLKKEVSPKL